MTCVDLSLHGVFVAGTTDAILFPTPTLHRRDSWPRSNMHATKAH